MLHTSYLSAEDNNKIKSINLKTFLHQLVCTMATLIKMHLLLPSPFMYMNFMCSPY